MELREMRLEIKRIDNNDKVEFKIPELQNCSINVTDSSTEDIENLFNLIFMEIINCNKLIKFYVEDSIEDLFNELAKDLVIQLNTEIKNSETDFETIINMKLN